MTPREFVLDEGGDARLETVMELSPRWRELAHAGERSRAVVLVPGELLRSPWLEAEVETQVSLVVARGLPQISADGLTAELWLLSDAGPARKLLCWTLDNEADNNGEAALLVTLPLAEGQRYALELRCGPGPQGIPDADWLAVIEWVVGRFDRVPLLRARTHAAWRLENELAHFSGSYDAAFYANRQNPAAVARPEAAPLRELPAQASERPAPDLAIWDERLRDLAPQPAENAFHYAHRLLRHLLPVPAPDFAARLRMLQERRPGQPLRMLSLCAGNAAVERSLLERADVPVRLCLVDVNPALLERAANGMPACVEVDRVLGNVDQVGPDLGEFDVVNITSGLHHLVELERVLAGIAATLAPEGEFWLIGEQIGRNGNRLWPDAAEAADAVFCAWPEQKRRNAGTGQVDARIPKQDFSRACFEGIRSQDIEGLLGRYFLPVDVHVRDCFLWRLVDPAYAGNFDLADPADLALVRDATRAEALHWLEGGRGTSVNGVWRSKRDVLRAPPLPRD
ncbi:class I SAM-dependent methyltransferase [Arenimonas donghaensis]|nr:class I SAM-dependent methyltransferase [Arenimonas donghaensis]